jgi:hypothetical protein
MSNTFSNSFRLRLAAVIDVVVEPRDIDNSSLQRDDSDPGPMMPKTPTHTTDSGQPLYQLDVSVRPPRVGSVNSAVWTLAGQLPSPFTRDQFESVVPKAMRYNPVTGAFGVRTSIQGIRQARQAYFSEFKKRRWLVHVPPIETPRE